MSSASLYVEFGLAERRQDLIDCCPNILDDSAHAVPPSSLVNLPRPHDFNARTDVEVVPRGVGWPKRRASAIHFRWSTPAQRAIAEPRSLILSGQRPAW